MPYRRNYRRARRTSRPTERIIRADNPVLATAGVTVASFMYTVTDPQTVTRFKLDTGIQGTFNGTVAYALVVVPEGYNNNAISYPAITTDLYNPTTNVLISGVLTDTAIEDHKSSSYSRKLKTGDRIALLYNPSAATQVSYEISFTTVH